MTCCAPSRNSAHWQGFLTRLEQANPTGTIAVITDNLSSHSSLATRAWLAGQTFADATEIAHATELGTAQLNAHAKPWVWGRPPSPPRFRRRRFTYLL